MIERQVDADIRPTGRRAPARYSFSLSNLLLLVSLIAVGVCWWVDRSRSSNPKYDIHGPLSISYTQTTGSKIVKKKLVGVSGIAFRNENVFLYWDNGGVLIPIDQLIELKWTSN